MSPASDCILLRAAVIALSVLATAAGGCATSEPPPPPPPPPTAEACAVTGQVPIEDAHEIWIRIRTNAEKAIEAAAGDPNRGWLERSIESDGRALLAVLSRCEFDQFAVSRGTIRARLLFVIKAPSVEDRREAVQSVDQEFTALLKRLSTPRAPS